MYLSGFIYCNGEMLPRLQKVLRAMIRCCLGSRSNLTRSYQTICESWLDRLDILHLMSRCGDRVPSHAEFVGVCWRCIPGVFLASPICWRLIHHDLKTS